MFAKKLSYLLSSLLWSSLCYSAQVYVEKVESIRDYEDEAFALYHLVQDSVTDASHDFKLIDQPKMADIILEAKIIPIGEARIVSISKKEKGAIISTLKERINTLDDLDIVATRLTKAIMLGEDPQRKIGQITSHDQNYLNKRINTRTSWFAGFGPSLGIDTGDEGRSMFGYTIGFGWIMEQNMLKLHYTGFNGMNGNESSLGGLGVGYSYILNNAEFSPVVSTELNWGSFGVPKNFKDDNGIDHHDTEIKTGFNLGLSYGLLMFRTANVNLETSIVGNVFLDSFKGHHPAATGLRVTLYW